MCEFYDAGVSAKVSTAAASIAVIQLSRWKLVRMKEEVVLYSWFVSIAGAAHVACVKICFVDYVFCGNCSVVCSYSGLPCT